MSTTVTPAATADCPLWLGFLQRIMSGKQDMIDYLQRVSGYCLTGTIIEHVLFFLWGLGRNGKGTFKDALLGILGLGRTGYAATAPISTFTAQRHEQHPTELATFVGKRLVTATETEEEHSWATAKLKLLTGGDPISARFMHHDFFDFWPQFKVMILGNHKPGVGRIDAAIRARLQIIPFDVTIPLADRDKALSDKLVAEYPGILRWMIDGCLAWQRQGLAPPQPVRAATLAYLRDEDLLGAWLEECCVPDASGQETLQTLFTSWQSWCQANGEFPGTRRRLAQLLDGRAGLKRGYSTDATTRALLWHGIRVRRGSGGAGP